MINAQIEEGNHVTLVHSIRRDTPDDEELVTLFSKKVNRIVVQMTTNVSPIQDLKAIFQLYKIYKSYRVNIIHLHSSKAGALGRITSALTGDLKKTFYTPHGFAFLKQDISKRKRIIYLLIERLLSLIGAKLICCSQSEADLALSFAKKNMVMLVENSIPMSSIIPRKNTHKKKLKIVTTGRICYPKAPWRFHELASRMATNESIEFIWIGDGELKHYLLVDGKPLDNVSITGWKKRDEIFSALSSADIFVLFSLWEGMPLSLIEAQATGLPAVVLNVIGCKDVVMDGITGFLCEDMMMVEEKLNLLIDDIKLRERMGRNAAESSRTRFSVERMHTQMMEIYSAALS